MFCSVQGFRDLVWLPIEQYRKDGRIVRGFQRGTASFGTSTAMAALELTNRMVRTIQVNLPFIKKELFINIACMKHTYLVSSNINLIVIITLYCKYYV